MLSINYKVNNNQNTFMSLWEQLGIKQEVQESVTGDR